MTKELIETLMDVLEARKNADSKTSYTAQLFEKGIDTILKKVGEEATEVVIAAKDGDKNQIVYEVADLTFHLLVLLSHMEISPKEITKELKSRLGQSGLDEKAARKQRLGD